MAKHNKIGEIGEEIALKHLIDNEYLILERNWRYRKSEVDIIAKYNDILIFIEVKTRSSDYFGKPESFVNEKKKQMLYDAASAYTHEINHTWEVRFDIISVLHTEKQTTIEHFKDAFFPGV